MNPNASESIRCWAISDGAAGNRRQALALAHALGLQPQDLAIRLHQPWAALAPRLLAGARRGIRDRSSGAALVPPWPDIAIGCGRRAALLTRALREWSDGRCFTVQILDPRIDGKAFNLVVAPRHDDVRGSNVIHSIGALNPVDARWLAEGRTQFAAFERLPAPRTAVLLGATNRAQRLDGAWFDALLERLAARHATGGGSFLVTLSRRTPAAAALRLREAFAAWPGVFWANATDGDNPYAGILAWADRIVVSPDSVNMLSEACATGKPVYTFAPRAVVGKLATFHRELTGSGHLRLLDAAEASATTPPPLSETAAIAELVAQRWHASRSPRQA